jgi:branched-chain amino acid transport system substrate-binding protein
MYLILFVLSLVVFGCTNNNDTIKIGAAMPLTGDGATYGVPQRNAMQLAVEEINANGGIIGKKIVIDFQDDKAQTKEAVNIAQRFSLDKNIVAVLGYPNSGNAIAASKVFNQNNIPYIATSPTNPYLTRQGFNNVFRFAPTDSMQGLSIAEFIKNKLHINDLIILHDNGAYGKGLALIVEKCFKETGGNILLFDGIIPGKKDYKTNLLKIKGLNPRCIFYGGMMPEGIILVKQADELNVKTNIVLPDGCYDITFSKQSGTDCKNVYFSFLSPPWEEFSSSKIFTTRYQNKFHESVPPFAPYGFDAVLVLTEAIKIAKSSQRNDIINTLRGKNFQVNGITGKITFDKMGQSVDRRFYFYSFSPEGRLVLVY